MLEIIVAMTAGFAITFFVGFIMAHFSDSISEMNKVNEYKPKVNQKVIDKYLKLVEKEDIKR